MFDIWASMAELHQPCLYRPISDRMVGADGLVRREILASFDRLFCEHLAAGRASFKAPPLPAPIPATYRFINISALQKSIRRGDAEGAMRFAQQGCGLDTDQVFRRLAVCAVEDVGIGNLLAVGMALAAMGNKAMREHGATDELAAYLAYLLAISPKSRLACDLISIADYDRTLDALKQRLARAGVQELSTAALDMNATSAERMVAAWLLAGTSSFRGVTMPTLASDRRDFFRLMSARHDPLILYYVANRAAARISDAMFVSMLPIGAIVKDEPTITITRTPLPDTGMIAGFPAAAIDLHTSEGRLALSRFGRECRPIAEIVGRVPPRMRDTAVRHAVFIAEGGILVDKVRFGDADRIEATAHAAELAFASVKPTEQGDLIETVRAELPTLHFYRRNALASLL